MQMHASVYTSTRIHMYNAYTCARTCLYIYKCMCVCFCLRPRIRKLCFIEVISASGRPNVTALAYSWQLQLGPSRAPKTISRHSLENIYVDEMISYNTTKHETNIEKGAGLCLKFPSWSLTFTFVF